LTGAASIAVPRRSQAARASAEASSDTLEQSTKSCGERSPASRPSGPVTTAIRSGDADTVLKTMSRSASARGEAAIFAPSGASRRFAIAKPIRPPAPIQPRVWGKVLVVIVSARSLSVPRERRTVSVGGRSGCPAATLRRGKESRLDSRSYRAIVGRRGWTAAATGGLYLDRPGGLLEELSHPVQERAGVPAVDRAVIERLREDADRPNCDRVAVRMLDHDRLFPHAVGRQDRDLRLVDDRRGDQRAERAVVRQRV